MLFLITPAKSKLKPPLSSDRQGEARWACPICEGARFWPVSFLEEGGRSHVCRQRDYFWGLCQGCGTAGPSIKDSTEKRYSHWKKTRIDATEFHITEEVWNRRLADARRWAELTHRFLQPWLRSGMRKILDIGCGLGATLAEFQSRGWEAEGIDPDPNVLAFHKKQGLKTRICSFEEANFSSYFDLVSSAHAIYFAEDPVVFVKKAGSLLNSGGLFFVLCSQLLSFRNPSRPSYLTSWFPTRDSLRFLFHLNGFRLLAFRSERGSDFFLFEKGTGPCPSCRPRRAWLLHQTHRLRYDCLGRPLSLLKRLFAKSFSH